MSNLTKYRSVVVVLSTPAGYCQSPPLHIRCRLDAWRSVETPRVSISPDETKPDSIPSTDSGISTELTAWYFVCDSLIIYDLAYSHRG